jgi:phosphatidylserine/phosphatidylglycerophosphate/cardiolipin synthase-like enzyme
MQQAEWWRELVEAVRTAKEVELATYTFDDLDLFRALLAWFTDGSKFSLRINIDAEALKGTTPAEQRSRLSRLIRNGAMVYECKGSGRLGAYHVKELIVDRRRMFTGSANFASKSHSNRERAYTMTGANVTLALKDQAEERAEGVLWSGS